MANIREKILAAIRNFTNLKNLSWMKLFIWTVGVAGFTVCTVLDFMPLLRGYKYDNVATKIAVIKEQSSRAPNMSVCLPYYSGSLSKMAEWL